MVNSIDKMTKRQLNRILDTAWLYTSEMVSKFVDARDIYKVDDIIASFSLTEKSTKLIKTKEDEKTFEEAVRLYEPILRRYKLENLNDSAYCTALNA